jgi:hypothetical protein
MFSESRRFSVTGNSMKSLRVGSAQRKSVVKKSLSEENAYIYGGSASMFGAGAGNSNMNVHVSGPMATVSMLTGLVPSQEDILRKYYRDIYYYDAVGGSAADMVSTFPYSDFSLTGCKQERIEKYQESMTRLDIRSLMPAVTLGYLVEGSYCSSLIFNQRDKVFIDQINYPIDDCKVEMLPFFGTDPIITVKANEALRRFLDSNHAQASAIKKMLPPSLLEVLGEPAFELDPLTALYVARRTLPGSEPTSWLKRILPTYLIEKTLYRGTLVEAMRRQRSMLHIAMGDDTHEFSPEEMAETVNQFQLADQDPLGAVIGTRNNVQANEIRQGGEFWKWTDNIDTLTPIKLRAVGISEAFLSGDATFSNVETGMSVFMENVDALRSYLTHEVLTNKVFPIVAVSNDWFKEGKAVSTTNRHSMLYQLSNANDLDIPTVRWHKRLEAKSEENMMELLDTLHEKGFPIPLRMWAAAAKVDLNSLYHDLQEDEDIRTRLEKFSGKKIGEPQTSEDGGSTEGFEDSEFASVRRLAQLGAFGRGLKKVPLLSRSFNTDESDIRGKTKTGKDRVIHNQRAASKKLNQLVLQASRALNDPHRMRTKLNQVKRELGQIPRLL